MAYCHVISYLGLQSSLTTFTSISAGVAHSCMHVMGAHVAGLVSSIVLVFTQSTFHAGSCIGIVSREAGWTDW